MGEYAKTYSGEQVKIGTCENMYYLRDDQRSEIADYPFDADTLGVVRFRFPFPDEDNIAPGNFEDYERGVRVPGYSLPAELSGDEHHSVQLSGGPGYLVSIPCPESFEAAEIVDAAGNSRPFSVGKNGWSGGPVVSQQAHRNGHLVTLLRCGSCGAIHRLDTLADAEPVAVAFRAEADREEWRRLSSDWNEAEGRWGDSCTYGNEPVHGEKARAELHAIADRILAGYAAKVEA